MWNKQKDTEFELDTEMYANSSKPKLTLADILCEKARCF